MVNLFKSVIYFVTTLVSMKPNSAFIMVGFNDKFLARIHVNVFVIIFFGRQLNVTYLVFQWHFLNMKHSFVCSMEKMAKSFSVMNLNPDQTMKFLRSILGFRYQAL
jgi:hypothetical protein